MATLMKEFENLPGIKSLADATVAGGEIPKDAQSELHFAANANGVLVGGENELLHSGVHRYSGAARRVAPKVPA